MTAPPDRSAVALAAMLTCAGTLHLLAPRVYEPLIPRALPGSARAWVVGSGIAELACGVAVAVPPTRPLGGRAAAALLVAVFPGNAWMAWQWRGRGTVARSVAYARLPLQVPLVRWALRVGRGG